MGTIPTLLVTAITLGIVRAVLRTNRAYRRDPHALRWPRALTYLYTETVLSTCAILFTVRAVAWDGLTNHTSTTLAVAFTLATLIAADRRRDAHTRAHTPTYRHP